MRMAIIKLVYHGHFAQQRPGVALFPVRVCDTTQETPEEAEMPLDTCPQQITVRWCETKGMKGKLLPCKEAADYQAGQSEMPVPGIGTYLGKAREGIFAVLWGGVVSGQISGEQAVLAVSGFHFFTYILA